MNFTGVPRDSAESGSNSSAALVSNLSTSAGSDSST